MTIAGLQARAHGRAIDRANRAAHSGTRYRGVRVPTAAPPLAKGRAPFVPGFEAPMTGEEYAQWLREQRAAAQRTRELLASLVPARDAHGNVIRGAWWKRQEIEA